MANTPNNLDALYDALTPALAKAAVGDYDSEFEINPRNDRRVNELLVGYQILLDVINEKIGEIERIKASGRNVTLLDEVLRQPTE